MNQLQIYIETRNGVNVVSSRVVAEQLNKEHKRVMQDCREKLEDGVEFVQSSYLNSQNKEQPELLLTKDGFILLCMNYQGYNEFKRAYIAKFNEMEQELRKPELSPQLQVLINLELQQKEQEKQLAIVSEKVENIKEIVALSPTEWRKETTALLNKMATALGGYDKMSELRSESYKLLDERFGVDLQRRLVNKRQRMAENGACKTSRDKLNQLDVIGDDKKLIEGYISIIKEISIKYGAKIA